MRSILESMMIEIMYDIHSRTTHRGRHHEEVVSHGAEPMMVLDAPRSGERLALVAVRNRMAFQVTTRRGRVGHTKAKRGWFLWRCAKSSYSRTCLPLFVGREKSLRALEARGRRQHALAAGRGPRPTIRQRRDPRARHARSIVQLVRLTDAVRLLHPLPPPRQEARARAQVGRGHDFLA